MLELTLLDSRKYCEFINGSITFKKQILFVVDRIINKENGEKMK